MSFLKNNSSQFNVRGDLEKLRNLTRRIRPYRHAFIRVINDGPGSISYEYINNINEFGSDLIRGIAGNSGGTYAFNINIGLFKNLDNVTQETDIIHSAAENLPVISSSFADSTKEFLQINVFDFISAVTVDIDGEIILVIREFYE